MRQTAPAVYEWLARLWNARASRMPATPTFVMPEGPGWDDLWSDLCGVYLPCRRQNALAVRGAAPGRGSRARRDRPGDEFG